MNRKQFILVLFALVILGGAGLVLLNRHKESWSVREAKMGDKVLPNFRYNDVAAIHVKAAHDVNVARKNGAWHVRERGDYPANYELIRDLLIKIGNVKVVESETVGASQLERVDLGEPGKGPGSGVLLEFQNAQGRLINALRLGKMHMHREEASVPLGLHGLFDGRYALLEGEPANVLLISDALASVAAEPESWLNKEFFKIEKIQYVSLTTTNPANSWSFARDMETWPWSLNDGKADAGEMLSTNIASQVAEMLGFLGFVDVAVNPASASNLFEKAFLMNVLTFDHFAYTLRIGSRDQIGNYYMKVAVSADLSPEPSGATGEGDKPAETKELDDEAREKIKKRREKLAREQALAPWVYLVDSHIVEPLIRERAQMLEQRTSPSGLPATVK